MHQPGRLRLRPWLEEQIQSGEYPGVSWLDQAARIFQIPWKHAARHGWSIDRDATLFRSWAMHTGRYRPGKDKPDPKTWKANFRCALNSLADVCELREHSRKRGSDAFRVYRMLPKTHTHTRRRGLRLFKPRDRQTASIHDNRTSSNSNHGDTHTWNQPSVTPVESDPVQKTETPVDTTHGMWDARADEQNEAVFKLMDHLSSDVWNQSGWRAHTLWDHWHCAGDESPYSLQTDGYGELSGSNYIKELSDWTSHQHTLLP